MLHILKALFIGVTGIAIMAILALVLCTVGLFFKDYRTECKHFLLED